jgi:hypothetical protein
MQSVISALEYWISSKVIKRAEVVFEFNVKHLKGRDAQTHAAEYFGEQLVFVRR